MKLENIILTNNNKILIKPLPIERGGSGDSAPMFEEDGEVKTGKLKKNERERQRRLVVSEHFDALHRLLELNEKDDKISILQNAITRITLLQHSLHESQAKIEAYEEILLRNGIPFKKKS